MKSRTLPGLGFARLGLVALLSAGLMAAGCGGKSSQDEIVIGEYGSLTGSEATFGQSKIGRASCRERVCQYV